MSAITVLVALAAVMLGVIALRSLFDLLATISVYRRERILHSHASRGRQWRHARRG
jgi:hypothetical protein